MREKLGDFVKRVDAAGSQRRKLKAVRTLFCQRAAYAAVQKWQFHRGWITTATTTTTTVNVNAETVLQTDTLWGWWGDDDRRKTRV